MYDAAESPYASGGYYLARPLQHGPQASAKLIPERIFSASSCLCEFFPGSWSIRWSSDDRDQRERSAAVFGIPAAKIDGVVEWATSSFQTVLGWPRNFLLYARCSISSPREVSSEGSRCEHIRTWSAPRRYGAIS